MFGKAYRYYALGLLTLVYVLNFLDRQVLAILLQPIKEEFSLSDTQLGFLSGIAFAIFYVGFAIPIAAWADRGSRRNIIGLALGCWSLMTALCGLAFNYSSLLLARMGVAAGESGGGPPSQSLIADYFPPHQRARAMSVYYLGLPFGILFGFMAGGWINEFFGWRQAFFVVGIPGLVVAALVRLTLREPSRGMSEGVLRSSPAVPIRHAAVVLWRLRSYRHMTLGTALHAFIGYGLASWMPSFLMRSHGMGSGEVATWLALIVGFGGGAGTLAGGILAERWARRDERWYVWLPALAGLAAIPFLCFTYLYSDPTVAILVYTIPVFLNSFWSGPVHAVGQTVAPLRMRTLAAAGMMFFTNAIGLGLGPQIVGVISDGLHPWAESDSLRYALLSVVGVNLWSSWHYFHAAKTLRADIAAGRG